MKYALGSRSVTALTFDNLRLITQAGVGSWFEANLGLI